MQIRKQCSNPNARHTLVVGGRPLGFLALVPQDALRRSVLVYYTPLGRRCQASFLGIIGLAGQREKDPALHTLALRKLGHASLPIDGLASAAEIYRRPAQAAWNSPSESVSVLEGWDGSRSCVAMDIMVRAH